KIELKSAIGMRHSSMHQKAQGFMGGSFNTREFFHGKTAATVKVVKISFLVLVFPLPVALIAAAYALESSALPMLAFVVQYVGLMAERWYFFAEAKHPQNLYYQSMA
ncbi:MAG: DMSO reductase, partial [Candidatus Sedimenticola sp. 6PFRAG5]